MQPSRAHRMTRPRLISRIYKVDGDAMDALYDALGDDALTGEMLFMIGATACLVRFKSERDMVAFRLGLPPSWTGITAFDRALLLPVDLAVAQITVEPIIEQCSLDGRVRLFDLAKVYLPTVEDHYRLLADLNRLGYPTEIC